MRILFVTIGGIKKSDFGGGVVSNNNLSILEKMYGPENVTFYCCVDRSQFSLLKRIKFVFFQNEDVNHINKISANFDCVFLDFSLLGNLIKPIKRYNPHLKVVTFFHNIELLYLIKLYVLDYKSYNYLIKLLNLAFLVLCERSAVRDSDGVIFMTGRNERYARKIYGKSKYGQVLGLYIKDTFTEEGSGTYFKDVEMPTLLFVGSNFPFNVDGLRWFSKNVMPYVHARLLIVGKNMEHFSEELGSDQIEVIGSVEELHPYYYAADVVISPLLKGEGMKVKIVEALMYGKTIFGTKESFDGYDIEIDKVGRLCLGADDFIEAIRTYKNFKNVKGVNQDSRTIFLQHYSMSQYEQKLFHFFAQI